MSAPTFAQGNAMSWLHRIRLSQKFVVLGALALVMMALPATLYLLRVADDVRTAERRVDGAGSVIALQRVIQRAQNHRAVVAASLASETSLSALWKDDNEALKSLRPAARASLAGSIEAFEARLAEAPLSPALATSWKEALQRWASLDAALASGELKSVERSTGLHTEWIDSLFVLSERLIEEFGLTLAAERDSNALVDASFLHTPRAAEMLGRIRAIGTNALVDQALSQDDRASLTALRERLGDRLAQAEHSLALAWAADPSLKERLGGVVSAMKAKIQASLAVVEQRLIAAR